MAMATTIATATTDLPTPTTKNMGLPTRKTQANMATPKIPVLKLTVATKSTRTAATKNRWSARTVKVFLILSTLNTRDTRRILLRSSHHRKGCRSLSLRLTKNRSMHLLKKCMSLSLSHLNKNHFPAHLRWCKNLRLSLLRNEYTRNHRFKLSVKEHRFKLSTKDHRCQKWEPLNHNLFLLDKWSR